MSAKTYTLLNGNLVLAARAAVPVADRGFRFGDGVFETIRIHHHVPYQWELHQQRLFEGLRSLRITPPVEDFTEALKKLLRKNNVKHGFARISISRGVGSRGYAPHPPNLPSTWVIETLPALPKPDAPIALWLSSIAKIPLQCLPMNQKLAQGVNQTLALLDAQDHGCDEALQLTTDGFICETASANIFWIREGTLFTPPLDTGCLNGTTRDAVIRLSPVAVRTQKLGIRALEKAECVFITNSRLGIHPVVTLQPLGIRYKTSHSIMRQLLGLLRDDCTAYTTKHRRFWAGRK